MPSFSALILAYFNGFDNQKSRIKRYINKDTNVTELKTENGKRKTEKPKAPLRALRSNHEQSESYYTRRFKLLPAGSSGQRPIDFIRHSSLPEQKDLKNFPFQTPLRALRSKQDFCDEES